MCTAGEEKLAGEPGGRKGWSRRQAERAAEMPPAMHTTRKREEIKRQSRVERERARAPVRGRVSEADGKKGIKRN